MKTVCDTSNTNNSNQVQWQKYNQLSRIGRLYDILLSIQNDNYNTCIKNNSSIKLLSTKEDYKWFTNTQKILQFLTNGCWNMWRKKVLARRYWSWIAKLLNRAKNKEKKQTLREKKQYHSIIAPAAQGNRDASHLQHTGGAMHPGCIVTNSAMDQGMKLSLAFAQNLQLSSVI